MSNIVRINFNIIEPFYKNNKLYIRIHIELVL